MSLVAAGKSARRRARTQEALDLRVAGKNYRAIGEALGVSHMQAFRDVSLALAELATKTNERAEEVRTLELRRLDGLVDALWPRREDAGVARTLLMAMERRSRLLGLDVKPTLAIEGHDGGPVTVVHQHLGDVLDHAITVNGVPRLT